MLKLAVIGKDVHESESPRIHAFLFRAFGKKGSYEAVSVPPEEFSARAERLFAEYDGFNVTIPYKGRIIPYLAKLKGDARAFGAVNTVVSSAREGYNTDGLGFLLMLQNAEIDVKGRDVLVLGAGGAGRSCIKKLTEAGANVFACERDEERLFGVYGEFGGFTPCREVELRHYDLLVNCTGIGMHDTVGKTPVLTFGNGKTEPVGVQLLSLCDAAADLIYVPAESELLRVARTLNKKTVNGAAMLFYQAYYASCIFTDRTPDAAEARALYRGYTEENQ